MKKKLFILLAYCLFITWSTFSAVRNIIVKTDFELAEIQYDKMLTVATDYTKYPRSIHSNGSVGYTSIKDWTGGFWPGCLWYVYEFSKDEKWKKEAIKWTESLEKNQYNTSHHDIGFMMNCSYGNAYRLTGKESYKSILVQSAKSLIARYDSTVGAIKSWDSFKSWDGKSIYKFPVIIDNMMNLELLFLASKLTGDPVYRNIAVRHAETTLKNHFRSDMSCYHVVNYDPKTGEILSRETVQGFSDNSAWARGQSWAVYGFTMVYRETKNPMFLQAALKMANFYINNKNLPKDKIPYWDYDVGQQGYVPNWKYDPEKFKVVPRDASTASITCSALLELSTYVKGGQKRKLVGVAERILKSLSSDEYRAKEGTNGFFVLKHSTGSLPHNSEIDVPLVYADYYFLEALLRYNKLKNNNHK